jgi:probable F420-dependent oxidoreductase
MRIGITLPSLGRAAKNPKNIIQAAQHAEALGYRTLWVADRLLYPTDPRTPYAVTPDGSLPEFYKNVLDPLETLTFSAAHTTRIGLGTGVLDIPFYNPVVLARRLTTLDIFSGGRLRVGFGLGWSEDEFEAVGVPLKGRGARAEEFIQVLKAIWTTDPVEFHGKYYDVPRSIIGPKPAQKPHPPIYLAAFVPAALKRAAKLADGWLPAGLPFDAMSHMVPQFRNMIKGAGRDPVKVEVIFGSEIKVTSEPLRAERRLFTGSKDQIRGDVDSVRDLGIDELFFMVLTDEDTIDSFLSSTEAIWSIVSG